MFWGKTKEWSKDWVIKEGCQGMMCGNNFHQLKHSFRNPHIFWWWYQIFDIFAKYSNGTSFAKFSIKLICQINCSYDNVKVQAYIDFRKCWTVSKWNKAMEIWLVWIWGDFEKLVENESNHVFIWVQNMEAIHMKRGLGKSS